MKLTDMVKTGWNYTKKVAKPVGIFIAGTYIILNAYSCDRNNPDPKDKINLVSATPDQGSYIVPKGEPIPHIVLGENESGRPVLYEFSLNGITVQSGGDDNSYDMPREDPGDNLLLAIMYSMKNGQQVARDTLAKWDYEVLPTEATAIDAYMDMQEEETKKVGKNEITNNEDNLPLEHSVTSTSNGVTAQFVGDSLSITGDLNYFGSYEVNFQIQGETTDHGKVSGNITNIDDPPTATNVNITPLEAFVGDTIRHSYNYSDVEGDLEGNTIINQYVNNQLINNDEELPTNNLAANDRIKKGIIPVDENGVAGNETFSNEITLQANPYVTINGRVLDTDTQKINASLLAWVVAQGDTAWANSNDEYQIEVTPTSNLELRAGYRTLDKTQPKSFVTTIKDINANTNIAEVDIAVVTYDNMNTTPEEFILLLTEANSEDGKLRALRQDMSWNIYKTGKYGETYSEEEISALVNIAEYINSTLVRPLPINIDRTGYFPTTIEEAIGKIIVEKWSYGGLGTIAAGDEDNPKDGRVDIVEITVRAPVEYPGTIREEFASATGGFKGVEDSRLAGGKTIFFEHEGINLITYADEKVFTTIQCLTDNIGGLYPYIPIEDILKIQ